MKGSSSFVASGIAFRSEHAMHRWLIHVESRCQDIYLYGWQYHPDWSSLVRYISHGVGLPRACFGAPTNRLELVTPARLTLNSLHSSGYTARVAQVKLRMVDTALISQHRLRCW